MAEMPGGWGVDPEDRLWSAFYQAVQRFRLLTPWAWMSDRDVFGVVDSKSGEVGWCCVIGAAGTLKGLILYRGDDGFDTLRRSWTGEMSDDDACFGQNAIALVFVDEGELSPDERERIRASGVSFCGAGEWPTIESQGCDRLPRAPDAGEVARMLEALQQVAAVAPRVLQEPSLVGVDRSERLLVRMQQAGDEPGPWIDRRRPAPAVPRREVPEFDIRRAELLRQRLPGGTEAWECDIFAGCRIVSGEAHEPYLPVMLMVAEAESGSIVALEAGRAAGREVWIQEQVLNAFEKAGRRPARLRIRRSDLADVITPLAEALGVGVERVGLLKTIERVRSEMAASVSEGGR